MSEQCYVSLTLIIARKMSLLPNDVLKKIERALRAKLPTVLEKILVETGFDSEVSLMAINKESILENSD